MTIDGAIKHCEEVAEEQSRLYSLCPCPCDGTDNCMSLKNGKDMGCTKCAADHRQLAEWLMEYKDLKAEQNDQYVFIRELISELKKAKRLLGEALRTLNDSSCNKDCRQCKWNGNCEMSCRFAWIHTDEALKLIGENNVDQ